MRPTPDVLGLIPAAGRAVRLGRLPCSKELLPIGFRDTPEGPAPKVACHYLLDRFRAAGIRRAGDLAAAIQEHSRLIEA